MSEDHAVKFKVRSRFEGYNTRVFDSVVIDNDNVKSLNNKDFDQQPLAWSQWRLDIPADLRKHHFNDTEKVIYQVAEKILLRGRFTRTHQETENHFKKLFKSNNISLEYNSPILNFFFKNTEFEYFDGMGSERKFYNEIIHQECGEHALKWVTPQVELASLLITESSDYIETKDTEQRVDFFVHSPFSKKKLILELDDDSKKIGMAEYARDRKLRDSGCTIIRIKNSEIKDKKGTNLLEAIKIIKEIAGTKCDFTQLPQEYKLAYAFKCYHQLQVTLNTILSEGYHDFSKNDILKFTCDLGELDIISKEEATEIAKKAVDDYQSLINNIRLLYGLDELNESSILYISSEITQTDTFNIYFGSSTVPNTFYIGNLYYNKAIYDGNQVKHKFIPLETKPHKELLTRFLKYIFWHKSFKEKQYEGIANVLVGKDTLLLLPTGSGKSVVYQLASLLMPGMTIVIDPITSLMDDQIYNLRETGISKCVAIHSAKNKETQAEKQAILSSLVNGYYDFILVSPERFQINEFKEALKSKTCASISLATLDEVHCVSEWGHDFRTSYLSIGKRIRDLCNKPILMGLTGTAAPAVLSDLKRILEIHDKKDIITPLDFIRRNLEYIIINSKTGNTSKDNKLFTQLEELRNKLECNSLFDLNNNRTNCGIIFSPHVNGDIGIHNIKNILQKQYGTDKITIHAGQAPKGIDDASWTKSKVQNAREFKENKVACMVATKSYGMGIDKPNIRYTVHINLPPSIESFYQESGRAGRDKKKSYCIIISDIYNDNIKLLDPDNMSINEIYKSTESIKPKDIANDDIRRNLYFHTQSYSGIENEIKTFKSIIKILRPLNTNKTYEIAYNTDNEKAIYKMVLIGVIDDYSVDYSKRILTVKLSGANVETIKNSYLKYIGTFDKQRRENEEEIINKKLIDTNEQDLYKRYERSVANILKHLLHFNYEVIEASRRRAMFAMYDACQDIKLFLNKINDYLAPSEFENIIDYMMEQEEINAGIIVRIIDNNMSPKKTASIRGYVTRMLESYPFHPGLLFLRSISEIICTDCKEQYVINFFNSAIQNGFEKYSMDITSIIDIAKWGLSISKEHKKQKLTQNLAWILAEQCTSRTNNNDTLYKNLDTEYIHISILSELNRHVKQINEKIINMGENNGR